MYHPKTRGSLSTQFILNSGFFENKLNEKHNVIINPSDKNTLLINDDSCKKNVVYRKRRGNIEPIYKLDRGTKESDSESQDCYFRGSSHEEESSNDLKQCKQNIIYIKY